jgi:protein-disulfide isomerase
MNTSTVKPMKPLRAAYCVLRAAYGSLAAAVSLVVWLACNPRSTPSAETEASDRTAAAAADSLRAKADRARVVGDSVAPLWLLIVSDFQCPFCAHWHRESHQALRDQYVRSGKVRLAYLNYPLEQHRYARVTANAALCAGAQDRFWPMHDAIFSTQARWSAAGDPSQILDSLAASTGIDVALWRSCMREGVMDPLVLADSARVAAAGVSSTPTLLITQSNRPAQYTHLIRGAVSLPRLRHALDSMYASGTQR